MRNVDVCVESTRFYGNKAVDSGGGVLHFGSGNSDYLNCLFVGNYTSNLSDVGSGAGVLIYRAVPSGTPPAPATHRFINCDFVSNECESTSNAVGLGVTPDGHLEVDPLIVVKNCIFWDNKVSGFTPSEDDQLITHSFGQNNSFVNARHSIIQGLNTGTFDNCNVCQTGNSCCNLRGTPVFMVNPSACGSNGCTDYGYLYLRSSSGGLDVGEDSALTGLCALIDSTHDFADRTRIVDGPDVNGTATVDMGAYEWSGQCHSSDDCAILYPSNEYMCCNSVCDGICCTDGNCSAPVPYCRTTGTNTCVQCLTNGHCGAGNICCDNICRSGWGCCSNSDCKDGKICCETNHLCVLPALCGY